MERRLLFSEFIAAAAIITAAANCVFVTHGQLIFDRNNEGGKAINSLLALNDIPFWFFILLLAMMPLIYLFTQNWSVSILIPYIFFILGETVLFRTVSPEAKYHLDVFWSYRAWSSYWIEILTNIILFIPLGLLLGKTCGWKGILISAGMSVAIEVMQLIKHLGLFEFDDIIHNSIGALMGTTLHILLKKYSNHY